MELFIWTTVISTEWMLTEQFDANNQDSWRFIKLKTVRFTRHCLIDQTILIILKTSPWRRSICVCFIPSFWFLWPKNEYFSISLKEYSKKRGTENSIGYEKLVFMWLDALNAILWPMRGQENQFETMWETTFFRLDLLYL